MNRTERILRSFRRAEHTYEEAARIQKTTARAIASLLAGRTYARALEFGCGTGLLTRELRGKARFGTLSLNDLFRAAALPADCPFLEGDIETIPLPGNLNLIVSNAVIQWVRNLPELLNRFAEALAENGELVFSTFGPENFRELREMGTPSLDYLSREALCEALEQRFHVNSFEEGLHPLSFDSPDVLLAHLRHTGVNALGSGVWTRARLAQFRSACEAHFHNTLTCHTFLVQAVRKG